MVLLPLLPSKTPKSLYPLYILCIYDDTMKKIKLEITNELKIKGIIGFIRRKVTPFGNGAKVDCPKEYLNKTVYLVMIEK